jgi:TrpR family trp operon transcriptional repressor
MTMKKTTRKKAPKPSQADIAELTALLERAAAAGDLSKLLDELLTPTELRDLCLRMCLLRQLTDGTPQRKISETLGISLCKITRGSRILKTPGSIAAKLLKPE